MSSPAARDRAEAAARSATLANLFERLAAADARARRRGSTEIEDVDDALVGANMAAGPSDGARAGRGGRQRKLGDAPPASSSSAAPPPPTAAPVRPQAGVILLRSGRAVALSANSRRLPLPFLEQAKMVTSVEATTTAVRGTLQQLHRDLAVHNRGHNGLNKQRNRANTSLQAPDSGGSSSDSETGYYGPWSTTAAAQRRMAEEEAKIEKLRIQRARAAAADEGAWDEQSVEDYGADCDIPPLTGETQLEEEVASIAAHYAKAKQSAVAMQEIENLAPTSSAAPWWSSALRLRDMKASAVRLGYHARAALGWSHRAREQMLLQVAHLNNVSAATRTQLLQQQQHWQEFQTRLRDGQQLVSQMHTAIAQWQAQAQEETNRRAKLQNDLLERARVTGVVDAVERNHLKAELALLLTEREWPTRSLEMDAQTVLDWLRSSSTPLE